MACYVGVAFDSFYAEEVKSLQACTQLRPFPSIEPSTNYGAKGLWGKSNKCARDFVSSYTECYCTAEGDNTCQMWSTVPAKDCNNVLDTYTAYLQYGVAVQATSGTACFFLALIELVVLCFLNKHPTPEQLALIEAEGQEYASGLFEDISEDFGVVGGDTGAAPIFQGEGYFDESGDWVPPGQGTEEGARAAAEREEAGVVYDEDNIINEESKADEGGYYDDNGEWVAAGDGDTYAAGDGGGAEEEDPGGYYDEEGNWIAGYYDADGNWMNGYYDEQGQWVSTDEQYVEEELPTQGAVAASPTATAFSSGNPLRSPASVAATPTPPPAPVPVAPVRRASALSTLGAGGPSNFPGSPTGPFGSYEEDEGASGAGTGKSKKEKKDKKDKKDKRESYSEDLHAL